MSYVYSARNGFRNYFVPFVIRSLIRLYAYCFHIPVGWWRSLKKQNASRAYPLEEPFYNRKAFENYTPSAHDVFVCTWIKSGTNWLLQTTHQLLSEGRGGFEHIHDVAPWPDCPVPYDAELGKKGNLIYPAGKQLIKTHLQASLVPYSRLAKYIAVIRDPKEVFVSSYFFRKSMIGPLMPSVDEWLDMFLSPKFGMGFGTTWSEHTASYWKIREKPNVRVFLFNDMKKNHKKVIEDIAALLKVPMTASLLHEVMEKASFKYMKGIDEKFHPDRYGYFPWSKKAKMMRKGEAGSSSELLSEKQQKRIDLYCKRALAMLRSDFPYDEIFGLQSKKAC